MLTVMRQWLYSLDMQQVIIFIRWSPRTSTSECKEQGQLMSSDNPVLAETRCLFSASSLGGSPWLKGPSFARTLDRKYKPPTKKFRHPYVGAYIFQKLFTFLSRHCLIILVNRLCASLSLVFQT